MKKSFIVLTAAVAVLLAVFLAAAAYVISQKDNLVEKRIKTDFQKLVGSPVFLQGLRVQFSLGSWKEAAVGVEEIQIKSPSGYSSSNMAVLKDVEMILDPGALIFGRWQIKKLSANVVESYIETGLGGVNLAKIPALQPAQRAASAGAPGSFEIGRLELRLEKLYFVNPANPEGAITEFDMEGKTEVFDRVKNPDLLIQAPVLSFLNKLNKGSLGLPRGLIQESVKQSVS